MKTDDIVHIELIARIELFEFIRVFFADKKKYALLTSKAKTDHAWMLYRMLSIYYPKQVQEYQNIKTAEMIDFLHLQMYAGKLPWWIRTPKLNLKSDGLWKLEKFSNKTKVAFCKIKNVEYKSLEDVYCMFPDWVLDCLEETKAMLEQEFKKKRKSKSK